MAAAVKRIMQEARELANDPCTDYYAAPLEVRHGLKQSPRQYYASFLSVSGRYLRKPLRFRAIRQLNWTQEWHCTLRGTSGTEFEGGLYHFRILLPAEYPFRPPSIMMLTPNGRFELNTKARTIYVTSE